jgi:hypothetical protein
MTRRVPRLRVASGGVAVLAAIGLVALGPVRPARAADTVDQITGNGVTDSAVTVDWATGILGADNKTVVQPRDPTDFMYPDFQNLKVTVGQTENLVHQSIQVTWSGGKPTKQPGFGADFLQLMECYGDDASGPRPENCEYGSAGLINSGGAFIASRTGKPCVAGAVANPTTPPIAADGSAASLGCDPKEPGTNSGHVPPQGDGLTYSVPFTPVGTTDKIYGTTTDFYDRFNTNEIQQASTGPDGTGQAFFQTLTATQAPGLGCGAVESNGKPRSCWLVIVPRGEYEPNGWHVNASLSGPGVLQESPLGASSWAQRIQIHLGYDPIAATCPIGSATTRGMVGAELVSRAVFSWQFAVNSLDKCESQFSYASTPEPTNTAQLTSPGGAGLAFTTIPIGSEATRAGNPPPAAIPAVYAPVAVSAITFGFNINLDNGFISTPVKLTPRLVAKALTQSYRNDLPDSASPPDWAKDNPTAINKDPEFIKLNPEVGNRALGDPVAPLLTNDHSAINQQIWAWILHDSTARDWLNGKPDEYGMRVNEQYRALNLTAAPIDSFPRAASSADVGQRVPRTSEDLLPYVENYDDAASRVRAANNPEGAAWDPNKISPSGELGWWGNGGIETAGSTMMWAISDSANLANYGLVPADLCAADGSHCVSATSASVTAAVNAAKRNSIGMYQVDPTAVGSGAYPLVDITYAAVRADQDPAALMDYAGFVGYAIGDGQTPGVGPGQLPHGYLPLPNTLRAQAIAGVQAMVALANPSSASPTPGGATVARTTPPPRANLPLPTTGNGAPDGGAPPVVAGVTPSVSAAAYSTEQVSAPPPAKPTPAVPVGPVRWTLLSVVVAGVAGAGGGPLLRLAASRRVPS